MLALKIGERGREPKDAGLEAGKRKETDSLLETWREHDLDNTLIWAQRNHFQYLASRTLLQSMG